MVPVSLAAAKQQLEQQFEVLSVVDLDHWHTMDYEPAQQWLIAQCESLHRAQYQDNQRLVFQLTQGDYYVADSRVGLILRNLQIVLNEVDISNFFVVFLSPNPNLMTELDIIRRISSDSVPITGVSVQGPWSTINLAQHPVSRKEIYQYGSLNPVKIDLNQLSEHENFLLTKSKVFCIYPWTHIHAWPTGQAFPCCMSEPSGQIGDTKQQTLREIWNGPGMKQLRLNMTNERPSDACVRCYEQEEAGFFSGRLSANKHHGHHVDRVLETQADGTLDRFEMTYWDIRFSNLCNLRCRSCGHIFSSNWYQDQARLAGPEWKRDNLPLKYAGRHELDMWEQLEPHLDYVEQIYFAGGEPLLMEEHYRILEELVRRQKFDVRLIYNTNFTQTYLKTKSVFEYWRQFRSVAVGASLDASHERAEYIRKGTDWQQVVENRREMLRVCPQVDFYISPTLSLMNAWHLPDFHREWVEQGLIRAQDLNVNILQDPKHYRIDVATEQYKDRLEQRFQDHLTWLRPQDPLQRATVGFESAIKFMRAQDNTHLLDTFWLKTNQLDVMRSERLLDVLPELASLR